MGRWQTKNPIIGNLYEKNIPSLTYSYPPIDGGSNNISTGNCSLSGIELFKLLGENVIRSFSNKKYSPYLIMYSINNEYLGNVRLLNKGWYISLEYDNSVLTKINNNKIVNSMEVYFKRLPNKSYPIIKTHEYNK